ncbi:MAG: outer membrane lipoprotein-sorting protein [Bacteroidetes bacterium]|nr:MAG: outer membrane lipoprotein-sorting protein [Bacteroidota bacterium]
MKIILFSLSFTLALSLQLLPQLAPAQTDARDIIERAENKLRGKSSRAEMRMTIIRPDWTREVTMKTWGLGRDYSLTLITSPARDKGTAFLKRKNEIWNWQPTIDRTIKMPPSMMMQSWMGSDLTNDDLVRESSILEDYEHRLLGEEEQAGRQCWKIELRPKPDAAVVWGRILIWIDQEEYMQLRTEFYDEDGYLVNTMLGKSIKELDGQWLPSVLEIIPADKPGHKTILEYLSLEFDVGLTEDFFTIQQMKRLR